MLMARQYSMTRKRKISRPRDFSLDELLTHEGRSPADEIARDLDSKVQERPGQETVLNVRASGVKKPSNDN
jgi:hypothetical protein